MAQEPETATSDGEWILHEGPGPYTGWLYRHPDGTLVTEDGTVLEYADDDPEPDPPAEPEDRMGEEGAPAPVTRPAEPDPAPEPQPGPQDQANEDQANEDQPQEQADAAQPQDQADEASPQDRVVEEGAPAPVTRPAEPDQAPEPERPRDPGWVFHDTDDHRGWLYEHADGRLVADDGTEVRAAAPASPEEPAAEVAAAAAPEPEPEAEAEAEAAPEPGPEPGVEAAPEPEAEAEAEAEPDPDPEPAASVPPYLRWETSALPQYAAGAVFLAAAIGAVLLVVTSLSTTTDAGRLTTGAALALLAAAAFYGVSALAPTTVIVRDAKVTVAHGGSEKTFDLTDPETRVDLDDKTGSAAWRAKLRSPSGEVEVLRRNQVQPRVFGDVVRHHLAARETVD